jgi:hypothetical protein
MKLLGSFISLERLSLIPMFLKKNRFFIEYPAWKIMGGNKTLKKISGSKVAF